MEQELEDLRQELRELRARVRSIEDTIGEDIPGNLTARLQQLESDSPTSSGAPLSDAANRARPFHLPDDKGKQEAATPAIEDGRR